jgi:hypothetical protein
MSKRRNLVLLLAGAAVFTTSVVCGLGVAPIGAPTTDLNPTGPGQPAPTQASSPTSFAVFLPPTPTAVEPGQPALPSPEPALPSPQPAIQESRRVTLEYPSQIKVGDSDIVRLTLEVDTLGNITPTAQTQDNVVKGQIVQVPNVYDTHIVIAEARLDLAGVDIRPGDIISEPLLPGESVTFYWSVHLSSPGTYRGTAWLFLRFVDKVTKEESRKALSAQTVQISTADLFGINGNLARMAGGLGSIVGAVLGFPFVDDVLKWLWKRVKRTS